MYFYRTKTVNKETGDRKLALANKPACPSRIHTLEMTIFYRFLHLLKV